MPRTYFTLIEWSPDLGKWCPQFGDYSRRVVKDEWRDSYKASGLHYRIIASGDEVKDIEEAIAREPALE